MKSLQSFLAGLLCLIALLPPASATTVRQFPFDELVASAALIFEGEVSELRSEQIDGLVYTFVRFEVREVLKGRDPGTSLELRFLGGEAGGSRVQVAEQSIPRLGEAGFYFVDSLQGNTVNPLLGWSQGRFLIETDEEGREIVLGSGGREEQSEIARLKSSPLAEKMSGMKFDREVIEQKLAEQGAPARVSPSYFRETIRMMTEAPQQ